MICNVFRWIIDLSVLHLLKERKLRKPYFIVTENYHIQLKEQIVKELMKTALCYERKQLAEEKTVKISGKALSKLV
jgi:hypothetical protein